MARHHVTWVHRTPVGVDEQRGADVYDEDRQAHDVEAESPERAAAEALLGVYGALRPAMAPSQVDVDGVAFDVDEWLEAEVHLRAHDTPTDQRACAERGLRHLRLARKMLAPFNVLAGDEARRGRGVHAELGELEARTEVLVADLGGRP